MTPSLLTSGPTSLSASLSASTYSDFMHFIICLSHVSIYGPLAVTICNHVSPTTRAAPEPHSMKVYVCVSVSVSVRVCVATFSGMTPSLEQATGNGKPLPPKPALYSNSSCDSVFPSNCLCECHCDCVYHMAVPLIRSTGPRSSLLAACCLQALF